MKKLIILGCSGSIGRQTADVVRNLQDTEYACAITGLSVYKNIALAEAFVREFRPRYVAVADPAGALMLEKKISDTETEVLGGEQGLLRLCEEAEYDLCVNGVVGIAGLLPTLKAVETGHSVALANKETLIAAGEIVLRKAAEKNVSILPLDSEHSAIFQCLNGENKKRVRRLLLTASGGPFFGLERKQLRHVKKEQALQHPSWKMGAKITVDCATMMNKGLEIIEAVRLFSVPESKIDVLVHRESIVHSMVEFEDFSVIAQLGNPDMRVPIQYGLTYPDRVGSPASPLDLAAQKSLHFYNPDVKTFKALDLARQAVRTGGTAPAVLNAANEVYVERFLKDEIGFLDIADRVEEVLNATEIKANPSLEEILDIDRKIRLERKR